MTLIFWSLIFRWELLNLWIFSNVPLAFRTCYQSKSFENLQQLKRKPIIKSIDSLSQANFTIVTVYPDDCSNINLIAEDKELPR
jgi:hypothetical protein